MVVWCHIDAIFITVISYGRTLRSLNAPQRHRAHASWKRLSDRTGQESLTPLSLYIGRDINRVRKQRQRDFSWIIKRMRCRRAQVPYADPPIAFRRESAMFFHSLEKCAGLGPSSSCLSVEHSHSRLFASRSDFSAIQFPPRYNNKDGDHACCSILYFGSRCNTRLL